MAAITASPWGPAQEATHIMPGIVRISTAGHGGYYVSEARLAEMPEGLRAFRTFAGPGWYEEDEDWSVVVLSFPAAFEAAQVHAAVRTARAACDPKRWACVVAWLDGPEADGIRKTVQAWEAQHADEYRIVASGSVPRRHEARLAELKRVDPEAWRYGWCVLTRIRDGAQAEALLRFSEEMQGTIRLDDIPAARILVRPE